MKSSARSPVANNLTPIYVFSLVLALLSGACAILPMMRWAAPTPLSPLIGAAADVPALSLATRPSILLAERAGELALVSAPTAITLTVGHVAYLPVEVQGYYRPITVTAQTLIHTHVNDETPAEPGGALPFAVDVLSAAISEIELQTLRLRSHPLTLTFTVAGQSVSAALTISPTLQPRTPLFGAGFIPACPACYWGGISEPYDRVYGPDCHPCETSPGDSPGTTRDVQCVRLNDLSPCACRPIQEAFDAEEAQRIRATDAMTIQHYASQILRHQIGWSVRQPYPTTITDTYLLDGLAWVFGLSSQARDYAPLINDFMEGKGWWMSCPDDYPLVVNTESGGSLGFYDESNAALVNEYRLYIRELVSRFGSELRFLETMNEPCYNFYLCPCREQFTCFQTWQRGPDHQVCDNVPEDAFQPHQTAAFADVYADFLFNAADIAAEELHAAGSDALLVAGALELSRAGLTKTTDRMIRLGLLEHDNVAFMIHQFPYPAPNWIEHEPCVYGPNWYLPPGCETPPPMQDYTTTAHRLVAARDMWQEMDEAVDVSEILSDVTALGQALGQPDLLSRFYLFDSELHSGFFIKDETTNGGRAAIAGLRVGAINAHQRFVGMLFTGGNRDPAPYNVMVRHLVGVTPVYRWDAPLLESDYSGLVYKLFTRGSEDMIAIWNNAAAPVMLNFSLAAGPTQFREVTLTRIFGPECPTVACEDLSEAERTRVDVSSARLSSPPAGVAVASLQEFYFLSVISDRPGFDWLRDLTAVPHRRVFLPYVIRNG